MAIPADLQAQMVRGAFVKNVYQDSIYRNAGMDLTDQIVNKGQAIDIPRLKETSTLKTYVPGTDIDAPQTPDAEKLTLTIDQYKYVNVSMDDIHRKLASIDAFSEYVRQTMASSVEDIDATYRTALLGSIDNNSTFNTDIAVGASNNFDSDYRTKLVEAIWDVQTDMDVAMWGVGDRLCYLHPEQSRALGRYYEGRDFRILSYADQNASGEKLDKVWGIRFMPDVNMPTTGTRRYQMIFARSFDSFAHGFRHVASEMYRPHRSFETAYKALMIFGTKLLEYPAVSGKRNPREPRFVISHDNS